MSKLTREEVLNMPAGREMDALVAERVMRLPVLNMDDANCPVCGDEMWHGGQRSRCTSCNRWWYSPYKEYSEDISAAWEVVEKIRDKGWMVNIESDVNGQQWGCDFKDDLLHTTLCTANAAPLAICRAALLTTLEAE